MRALVADPLCNRPLEESSAQHARSDPPPKALQRRARAASARSTAYYRHTKGVIGIRYIRFYYDFIRILLGLPVHSIVILTNSVVVPL